MPLIHPPLTINNLNCNFRLLILHENGLFPLKMPFFPRTGEMCKKPGNTYRKNQKIVRKITNLNNG